MVLHTFGRDLKWNPHIHCLISEGGFSDDATWRHVKHFKMIRYGDLYARHRNIDIKLIHAISREKHHIFRSFKRWRIAILSAFGYDPLECKCGSKMVFLVLCINHKHVSLEEMYEKTMSRSRGCRSTG